MSYTVALTPPDTSLVWTTCNSCLSSLSLNSWSKGRKSKTYIHLAIRVIPTMLRIPVLDPSGIPLMPTKISRARKWIRDGKAVKKFNDLGQFYVQLVDKPSGYDTQPISIGLDPGSHFSGIAVQSKNFTLAAFHLQLPFSRVKEKMEIRKMLRRSRRSRRIDKKVPFNLRNHRQKRFSNRRKSKLSPSIRANKQLELRVIKELVKYYPVTIIFIENVAATKGGSFSRVMIGQKWLQNQVSLLISKVILKTGMETSSLRIHLGLEKDKKDKSKVVPETHATDAISLACYQFLNYGLDFNGYSWYGGVSLTHCLFYVVKRHNYKRRSLHLQVPSKEGIRPRCGGTVTPFKFRKGDIVKYKGMIGIVSGHTNKRNLISINDYNGQRTGQYVFHKFKLLKRNMGLISYSEGKGFLVKVNKK